MLRAIVEQAIASRCDRVLVVLGAHAQAIAGSLQGLAIDAVINRGWEEGLASSIRCGILEAEREGCRAALLLACDQPGLTTAHLDRLVDAFERGASLVASRYGGTLGVPALFESSRFALLRALSGDQGARHVIRAAADVAAVDFAEGAVDVDTEQDAARIVQ
jgi:molybdenum cofactor cytidylyltransferase